VLLTQYLATRTFLTAVAENSPVSEKFKQAGPDEADAILAKLAKSVSVSTPGPQLMTVSVTTKSASKATGTAEALLAQFERFQITDMHRQTQSQADYDKSQLDSAAAALKEAEHKLDKVRGSSSGRAKDPAAAAAVAAVELAQKAYADAATAYGKSSRALAASESTGLRVLDKPDRAWPQARKTLLIMGAVGGMMAGATLSLLALLVLMARDKTVRDEQDAARALSLDVVGAVPLTRLEVPDDAAHTRRAASPAQARDASDTTENTAPQLTDLAGWPTPPWLPSPRSDRDRANVTEDVVPPAPLHANSAVEGLTGQPGDAAA
jgi:capsular polysaccharide biosynthesis protein